MLQQLSLVSIRVLMITSPCAGLTVKIGQQPKPYLCEGAAESLQDLMPDSESHSYECLCIKIALTFELLWTGIISLPCFPYIFCCHIWSHIFRSFCVLILVSKWHLCGMIMELLCFSLPRVPLAIGVAANPRELFSECCYWAIWLFERSAMNAGE